VNGVFSGILLHTFSLYYILYINPILSEIDTF
jgi:hypothetical protein